MKKVCCLVWLEWPEKCFCMNAETLSFLKKLLPKNAEVIRVRSELSFLKYLPKATHAIVWHFKKEWFQRAMNLKVLATPGAGRELVAWKDAPKDIEVHFGGFHGEIISESVVGFMLAWAHGFFHPSLLEAEGDVWRKSWPRVKMSDSCFCLKGTNAVIAGYGKIGKAIGEKLESLGVNVLGFGRSNRPAFLKSLKDADWLIMALPSDTGTDNFLDRSLISKLPKRAVVINIGRGNSINEIALVDALKKKRIAGAYLDVFASEPGPLSHIKSSDDYDHSILGTHPNKLPSNLIKMPHSSAFSNNYLKLCFKELSQYFKS